MNLGRMLEVSRAGQTFVLTTPFQTDAHLRNSIGIYGADTAERIRVRFGANIAALVAERRWHRTQQIQLQPDGSAEFTMDVAVNPELEHWVLGLVADVEVLTPQVLRQKMAEVGRVLASRT